MIRVLIAEGASSSCDQIADFLGNQPDIEVIGKTSSYNTALDLSKHADLVLICTDIPGDMAYQLVKALNKNCSHVLLLGSNDPKASIVRLVQAGALGFKRRIDPLEEIAYGIRNLQRGEACIPADITAELINRLAELNEWYEEVKVALNNAENLTRREREVLHLIGRDFTNQDIANSLIIEVGTVKNHVHNILAKLKVNSRREAANYLTLVREQPRFANYLHQPISSDHYVS